MILFKWRYKPLSLYYTKINNQLNRTNLSTHGSIYTHRYKLISPNTTFLININNKQRIMLNNLEKHYDSYEFNNDIYLHTKYEDWELVKFILTEITN